MASILIDGSTNQLELGGGTWATVLESRFFGGSTVYPPFANDTTGQSGTLTMPFQGTSIAFYGNTPPPPASQWVLASLDGGTAYNTSYDDPSPPTSLQWYQSPILSDGTHTINFTHIDATSIDFMVVTAGSATPLLTQTLIVDDEDSDIVYSGNWARNSSRYTSSTNPHAGLPYHNTTHQATSAGPSATFRFRGTSVAVYSLFDYSRIGALSVTYTMDGFPLSLSYDVGASTPAYQQGALTIENTLMFSNGSLTAGDHTLVIDVTICNGQTFELDYILYSPSFNTISDKPNYGSAGPTTSSTSGSSASSNRTPPAPSKSTSSSPIGKSSPVGSIVGGVIGGIAALIAFFVVLCRKRLFNRYSSSPAVPATTRLSNVIEPYTAPATSQNSTSTYGPPVPQQKPRITNAPITHQPSSGPSSRSASSTDPLGPHMRQKSSTSLSPIQVMRQGNHQAPSGDNEGESNVVGTMFRNRMQRLQDLVVELNRAISENGEESSYALELRARIAELTREDAQSSEVVAQGRTVPPPYELSRGAADP